MKLKPSRKQTRGYNHHGDEIIKAARSAEWELSKEETAKRYHIAEWRAALRGFWERRGMVDPVVSAFTLDHYARN